VTTKILHVSDTHLGKRQYRSDVRLTDYSDAFEDAIETAISLDVDAVLHTGDLFDAPNPNVPVVNRCLDIIKQLETASIPFLGIVGNHERKRDEQWLDLVDRFDMVERLGRSPRLVSGDGGDVAVYGIDAVRRPEWESTDFTLDPLSEATTDSETPVYKLLAMHELLSPPVPSHMAHYETQDVLDRLGMSVDGLALGDYHEPSRQTVDGTAVWYPGSTEKTARDESEAHFVNCLSFDAGELTTHKHEIGCTRPFVEFEIAFGATDGLAFARRQIGKYEFASTGEKDAVAIAKLTGEQTGVTAKDVHRLLAENDAEVTRVADTRGHLKADTLDVETIETSEIESMIDDGVQELALSETSRQLESLVRDADVRKTNIREEGAAILDDSESPGDGQ
jgi:DNA repair exonuclease SbcCD nuclease subunit